MLSGVISLVLTGLIFGFHNTLLHGLFGLWLGWGVIGVAIGMSIDLVLRGAIFLWRLKSRRWTQFHLI